MYARTDEFDTADFIALPGTERGELNPVPDKNPGYHFGVLDDPTVEPALPRYGHLEQFPTPVPWVGEASPQLLIDELRAHGNLVVFNHPEWHLTRFDDMVKYDGFFAVEIYNHSTEWSTASSYGAAYWDHALQNGKRVFGIASDDSHTHEPDWKIPEYGGGWVRVQAEALTQAELIRSLKGGPLPFQLRSGGARSARRGRRAEDRVLPCKFIMFKAFPQRGPFIGNFASGKPLTEASMVIEPDMTYIRVECVDYKGNVVWTNPVFVADLLD